ncbi:MAG: NADPH-dependent F420 reductase [Gemmatimonadaceae bacterium]
MNIAVIGTGNVGGTLGRRFAAAGHRITFGAHKPNAAVKGGAPAGSRVTSVPDAVGAADVVVLTVPWSAVPNVVRSLGPVAGKVVVDVVNPVTSGPGGLALDIGPNGESAAERIAAMIPKARVVKAFNQTGSENMANPVYNGEPSVMFLAGDDESAKATARELALAIGFDAIDAGPLSRSRELEHLALLWISLAYSGMGRNIAFKLARR